MRETTMRPTIVQLGLGLVLLAAVAPAAAPAEDLKMYCWIGADVAGRLGVAEFDAFFRRAVKVENMVIDNRPTKATILSRIRDADIVYANTHSGYPTSGPPRMVLQTGTGGGAASELTALEIAELYRSADHLPSLVVINGCNSLSPPPGGGRILKIYEAFRIRDDTPGRAYLGFAQGVIGIRGDEFFRIFFAHWTREPYPSLRQAKEHATEFFSDPPSGQKFLDQRAKLIGEALRIVGDESLTWPRLSAAR